MRNYPECVVAYWATLAVGAAAVGVNAWWTSHELAYGLGDGNGNHPRVTALSDVIERSRSVVRIALGKRRKLNVCVMQNVGRVFIDPVQVERILVNLAVNAADACPTDGVITITLSEVPPPQAADGSRNRYILFEVRDTGCGISPEAKKHLFTKFYQAEDPLTRSCGGAGIGLYMAKSLVELHGGRVSAGPPSGQGAEFVIELPLLERQFVPGAATV